MKPSNKLSHWHRVGERHKLVITESVHRPYICEVESTGHWQLYHYTPTDTQKIVSSGKCKNVHKAKAKCEARAVQLFPALANSDNTAKTGSNRNDTKVKLLRIYMLTLASIMLFLWLFWVWAKFQPVRAILSTLCFIALALVTHRVSKTIAKAYF